MTTETKEAPTIAFRFVALKSGAKYIRAEDVVDYLREIAATEPTDSRNRLEQAAKNIEDGFAL